MRLRRRRRGGGGLLPTTQAVPYCGQVGCPAAAEYQILDLMDPNPYSCVVHACAAHVGGLLSHDLSVGRWKPGDRWEVMALENPFSTDPLFDAFLGGYEAVCDDWTVAGPKELARVRVSYEEWQRRLDPTRSGR